MPGCKGVTDSFLCLHSRAGWKEPQLEAGQGDEKAPLRLLTTQPRLPTTLPKAPLLVLQHEWQVYVLFVLTREERPKCY